MYYEKIQFKTWKRKIQSKNRKGKPCLYLLPESEEDEDQDPIIKQGKVSPERDVSDMSSRVQRKVGISSLEIVNLKQESKAILILVLTPWKRRDEDQDPIIKQEKVSPT